MASSDTSTHAHKLIIWDFDWSMINENCDVWVLKHLDGVRSDGEQQSQTGGAASVHAAQVAPIEKDAISGMNLVEVQQNWMKAAREGGKAVLPRSSAEAPSTWTTAMHALFEEAAYRGHTLEQVHEAMAAIPVFHGVVSAIRDLHSAGVTHVVLSDANTYLIDTWLKAAGIRDCFKHVISNHGIIGSLEHGPMGATSLSVRALQPQHQQHGCKNPCPPNLCKGGTLLTFLHAEFGGSPQQWPALAYVGDGRGDLCALLQLPEGSSAIVRGGYPLDKHSAPLLPSAQQGKEESYRTLKVPASPWAAGACQVGSDAALGEVSVRSGWLRAERKLWHDGEELIGHLHSFASSSDTS